MTGYYDNVCLTPPTGFNSYSLNFSEASCENKNGTSQKQGCVDEKPQGAMDVSSLSDDETTLFSTDSCADSCPGFPKNMEQADEILGDGGCASGCSDALKAMVRKIVTTSTEQEDVMTCYDVKEKYKASQCCGNPSKPISPLFARRLQGGLDAKHTETLLADIGKALDRAKAKGDTEVRRLAEEIRSLTETA